MVRLTAEVLMKLFHISDLHIGKRVNEISMIEDQAYILDQILQLIDSMPEEDIVWFKNDNDRKEYYRKILASGDHMALIKMIKGIYSHKKERESQGKRLHMVDEHFFKDAEQILYNEFQYVLNLNSKDELMQYIFSRIER